MRSVILGLIRLYQRTARFRPRTCRFSPSCSEYTAQSVQKYGAMRGSWMGLKRILRCNPFHPGGDDPVP